MCDDPLSWWEETVLQTQKETSNWLWPTADGSLKHDVLIMLPQHCQRAAAPQLVVDKGDVGGLGTLGQPIWKAAKDCGGQGEWAVNHGPTAVRCNNGRFRKFFLFEAPLIYHWKIVSIRQSYNIIIDKWRVSPEKDHHYSFLQTVPKRVS